MSSIGKILIADDEKSFSRSTADLLTREGYGCSISHNAETAKRMLYTLSYDLLIADIHMPGNAELELVKEVQITIEGLPIILITGIPSIDTATQSLHLPVVAYLTKPLDFEKLLTHVKDSINKYKTYCTFQDASQRLNKWQKDLQSIKELINNNSQPTSVPINTFFKLTFQNIAESLLGMEHLVDKLGTSDSEQNVCNLLDCPSLKELKKGLMETEEVLKKTKRAFKSKDLGILSKKLDKIIKDVK
ncbi:MAG: response regulator [Planctomycetota bacterium]|jgi:DNA-binding response OmpR family regulator